MLMMSARSHILSGKTYEDLKGIYEMSENVLEKIIKKKIDTHLFD